MVPFLRTMVFPKRQKMMRNNFFLFSFCKMFDKHFDKKKHGKLQFVCSQQQNATLCLNLSALRCKLLTCLRINGEWTK